MLAKHTACPNVFLDSQHSRSAFLVKPALFLPASFCLVEDQASGISLASCAPRLLIDLGDSRGLMKDLAECGLHGGIDSIVCRPHLCPSELQRSCPSRQALISMACDCSCWGTWPAGILTGGTRSTAIWRWRRAQRGSAASAHIWPLACGPIIRPLSFSTLQVRNKPMGAFGALRIGWGFPNRVTRRTMLHAALWPAGIPRHRDRSRTAYGSSMKSLCFILVSLLVATAAARVGRSAGQSHRVCLTVALCSPAVATSPGVLLLCSLLRGARAFKPAYRLLVCRPLPAGGCALPFRPPAASATAPWQTWPNSMPACPPSPLCRSCTQSTPAPARRTAPSCPLPAAPPPTTSAGAASQSAPTPSARPRWCSTPRPPRLGAATSGLWVSPAATAPPPTRESRPPPAPCARCAWFWGRPCPAHRAARCWPRACSPAHHLPRLPADRSCARPFVLLLAPSQPPDLVMVCPSLAWLPPSPSRPADKPEGGHLPSLQQAVAPLRGVLHPGPLRHALQHGCARVLGRRRARCRLRQLASAVAEACVAGLSAGPLLLHLATYDCMVQRLGCVDVDCPFGAPASLWNMVLSPAKAALAPPLAGLKFNPKTKRCQ